MRKKIGQLKQVLKQRGYRCRKGRGSHTIWIHPGQPQSRVVLSGTDSRLAPGYQVGRVYHGKHSRRGRAIPHLKSHQA
jgi:predicted RNA binding protein YcfA (HicA-like mRNA interferase family)